MNREDEMLVGLTAMIYPGHLSPGLTTGCRSYAWLLAAEHGTSEG